MDVLQPPHHLSSYHWKLRSSALSHNFTLSISVTWFSLSLLLLWVYWFKAVNAIRPDNQPTNQPAGDPDPSIYKHTQQSDDLQSNRRSSNNNNVDNLTIYTSSRSSSSNNDSNNNDDINDFNCQSPILTQSSCQAATVASSVVGRGSNRLASQLAGWHNKVIQQKQPSGSNFKFQLKKKYCHLVGRELAFAYDRRQRQTEKTDGDTKKKRKRNIPEVGRCSLLFENKFFYSFSFLKVSAPACVAF